MKYPNPFFAFVDVFLQDRNISPIPPEHIIEFTHNKTAFSDLVNSFSLTVFDETAVNLEYYLVASADPFVDIFYRYGYVGGATSEHFGGIVRDFSVNVSSVGAVLTIEGWSSVMKTHNVPRTRVYEEMDIHEIVAEVAAMEGWSLGAIETCDPIYVEDRDEDENAMLRKKVFVQDNIPSTKFILNKLTKYARSKETKDSGFEMFFDDISGVPVINFCTRSYLYKEPVDTFVTYYGREGQEVISFEPKYQGVLMMVTGASVSAYGVDTETGEFIAYKHDQETNESSKIIGSKTYMNPDMGNAVHSFSSASAEEMRIKSSNMWKLSADQHHTASMTIMGNPRIKAGDCVDVIYMTPRQVAHHTSGNYYVVSVSNSIRGGQFQTSLELARDALGLGPFNVGGNDVNDDITEKQKTEDQQRDSAELDWDQGNFIF